MDGSNCLTSIECRMVCSSGNFYNSELSTAAAAAQVEVLSPRLRCHGSTPPTESCRRGAGVAGVALALPSLQGDNVMPPGLVAAATANQVWQIQHIWVTLSLNKSRKWEEVSNQSSMGILISDKLGLSYHDPWRIAMLLGSHFKRLAFIIFAIF